MGKLWIPGGGSGAGSGSDECTASKSEVLKGYSAVTSDSDDEPVQGTLELAGDASDGQVLSGKTYYNTDPKKKRTGSMANQGAVSVKLNAGEGYTIPSGFHNGGGKIEANGLAGQTPGTATASHILSGQSAWVNGNKVNGGIPLQNVEISGSDRAWAQGMSNWAGTINLKVRNGHYLNGVNWIQQDIPEYQPWNIKRGVNMGGVVGTFEGWVGEDTDLYISGNNKASFGIESSALQFASGSLESGMMYLKFGGNHDIYLRSSRYYNFGPYTKLNIYFFAKTTWSYGFTFKLEDYAGMTVDSNSVKESTYYTVSLDLSGFNATIVPVIKIWARSSGMSGAYAVHMYLHRIWLS
ncbi:hypothetical protein [Lacrimispora sp.]|uniref:hypothetical protein n=1 Tax=Lacrimispora sp. TaxID=2719234 RepID=UPI0028AE1C12|nr:hypothetical protein [Lacrimispora sp.]